MQLVVDASVLVAACLAKGGWERLKEHELFVPILGISEACSVLHEAQRRREISQEAARRARDRLADAPLQLETATDLRHAWELADELGLAKTYDAEYLALAQRLRCPLLSLDERLRRRAGDTVRIIRPTELPESLAEST